MGEPIEMAQDAVLLIIGANVEGRAQLSQCFTNAGYAEPLLASNSEEATTLMATRSVSAVILDLDDEPMSEIATFGQILESETVPLMVVASAGRERKLQALSAGAYDYVERPIVQEDLVRKADQLA